MEYAREHAVQKEVKDYPVLPIPAHSYTCVYEDEIVAVGGIKMYFEGVGESWIIMTEHSKRHGVYALMACRAIENRLNELIEELNLRRVEANVRADFPTAIRFVKALGFEFDGERKKWFPGNISAMLYSKTREV